MSEESEFGKGYAYCLGLFLAHAERGNRDGIDKLTNEQKNDPILKKIYSDEYRNGMWLYGAADHIYEFDAENAPISIRKRSEKFKTNVLQNRMLQEIPNEFRAKLIQEAKDLLRLYDEANGIQTQKGQWE